jgi:hypothetical protein
MYTAHDVISYMMNSVGGGAQDGEHRVLRESLFQAYRDLVSVRDWKYHFTSQDVPLATNSAVTVHLLPWGVTSVDSVFLPMFNLTVEFLDQTDFTRMVAASQLYRNVIRMAWTILPSKIYPDHFELRIWNGFRYNSNVTLSYRRRPKDLRLTGWEASSRVGSVAWDRANTVTGTGTMFNNHMNNAILRVSADPTKHPEPLSGMNAYADEGLIYQVVNQTKFYAWSPVSQMNYLAGNKYVVTDYLDISPQMYTALLSGTEVWMARMTGKNVEGAMGVYGRDLRIAFENDCLTPLSGRRDSSYGYRGFWYLFPGKDGGGSGGDCADETPNMDGGTPADDCVVSGGNAFTP